MNLWMLSGLQKAVLYVDGLKTRSTTKLSFATGNVIVSVHFLFIYLANIQPIKR